jgi:hypothetical protein
LIAAECIPFGAVKNIAIRSQQHFQSKVEFREIIGDGSCKQNNKLIKN